MSNLLASLVSSADTLEAYGRVLETTQNNVSNASTPGYAKQSIDLYALPFDPAGRSHRRSARRQAPIRPQRVCRAGCTAPVHRARLSAAARPTASPFCKPTSISPGTRAFRRPSTTSCRVSPPGAPSPDDQPSPPDRAATRRCPRADLQSDRQRRLLALAATPSNRSRPDGRPDQSTRRPTARLQSPRAARQQGRCRPERQRARRPRAAFQPGRRPSRLFRTMAPSA